MVSAKTSHRQSSDSRGREVDFSYPWRELLSHIEKAVNARRSEQFVVKFFGDLMHGKEGYISEHVGLGEVEDLDHLFTSTIIKIIGLS